MVVDVDSLLLSSLVEVELADVEVELDEVDVDAAVAELVVVEPVEFCELAVVVALVAEPVADPEPVPVDGTPPLLVSAASVLFVVVAAVEVISGGVVPLLLVPTVVANVAVELGFDSVKLEVVM